MGSADIMAKKKKRKLDTQGSGTKISDQPSKETNPPRRTGPNIPFEAEDRILLVGEGDFSFAKSIVEDHGCYDVTATCFDNKSELQEKYNPQAQQHVQYLEEEGMTVFYDIDATKLDSNKALKRGPLFDRILFNFPHVGGKSKDVNRQVRFNQELLVKFFASGRSLLAPGGTIVVTIFEGEPYTLWNIRDLARHSGLEVLRSFKFVPDAYPGYSHARTLGNIEGGGGWKGRDRDARSYVFQAKLEQQPVGAAVLKKRKRNAQQDSSDEGE